jgi:hypothetical protein
MASRVGLDTYRLQCEAFEEDDEMEGGGFAFQDSSFYDAAVLMNGSNDVDDENDLEDRNEAVMSLCNAVGDRLAFLPLSRSQLPSTYLSDLLDETQAGMGAVVAEPVSSGYSESASASASMADVPSASNLAPSLPTTAPLSSDVLYTISVLQNSGVDMVGADKSSVATDLLRDACSFLEGTTGRSRERKAAHSYGHAEGSSSESDSDNGSSDDGSAVDDGESVESELSADERHVERRGEERDTEKEGKDVIHPRAVVPDDALSCCSSTEDVYDRSIDPFYSPTADREDEEWLHTTYRDTHTDNTDVAVLNCASCFSTVCFDGKWLGGSQIAGARGEEERGEERRRGEDRHLEFIQQRKCTGRS